MQRLFLTVAIVCVASPAFATWSIIAVDQRTAQVVIASATCVTGQGLARFNGLMGIQAIIVPGRAIAAAQAEVDITREKQMLIYEELRKGTAPADIIKLLSVDPAFQLRQFAIIDLEGRMAGHSGTKNGAASLHQQGQLPGQPVFYSVQGNLLASTEVVSSAFAAFGRAHGDIADRVMAAMEAADEKGGDRRCTCATAPKVDAPCSAKSSHVAYILQADRTDPPGVSHNDGRYALYLSVTDRDITPAEDANPVKTLRMRYDAWKRSR